MSKEIGQGKSRRRNKAPDISSTPEEIKLELEAAESYSLMKALIREFVIEPRGKNLLLRTSKGMGEKYLLRELSRAQGFQIVNGPLRTRMFQARRQICFLPGDISERQLGATARSLPNGMLVLESAPRRIDVRLLPILAEERSRGQFSGKILVLAGEADFIPVLGDAFVVFEQIIVNALETLAIARQESTSIAGGLTSLGTFHSRAMVRVWTDITRQVLAEAAEGSRVSLITQAARLPLSISQLMIIYKLFPVIYPLQRDLVTRKEWISENLGLTCPPFVRRSTARTV